MTGQPRRPLPVHTAEMVTVPPPRLSARSPILLMGKLRLGPPRSPLPPCPAWTPGANPGSLMWAGACWSHAEDSSGKGTLSLFAGEDAGARSCWQSRPQSGSREATRPEGRLGHPATHCVRPSLSPKDTEDTFPRVTMQARWGRGIRRRLRLRGPPPHASQAYRGVASRRGSRPGSAPWCSRG